MQTFRDLKVWQQAHQLVLEVYRVTSEFPTEERYGLMTQMRRAGISIAANITEGHRRRSKIDFLHFLNMAHGSLDELAYYCILAPDLGYVTHLRVRRCAAMAEEVGRMLTGLQSHVKSEVHHV